MVGGLWGPTLGAQRNITVICWSNIGDAMAHAFRFCYWRICCYVYVKKTKKRRKRILSRQRA